MVLLGDSCWYSWNGEALPTSLALHFAPPRHWHVIDGQTPRCQSGNTRTCISCLPRVLSACVDQTAGSSGGCAVPVAAKVVH